MFSFVLFLDFLSKKMGCKENPNGPTIIETYIFHLICSYLTKSVEFPQSNFFFFSLIIPPSNQGFEKNENVKKKCGAIRGGGLVNHQIPLCNSFKVEGAAHGFNPKHL